jgi:hypothetical protein
MNARLRTIGDPSNASVLGKIELVAVGAPADGKFASRHWTR